MDLNQLISTEVQSQLTNAVSSKLNLPAATSSQAVALALPVLLGGLHKNAATPQGESTLHKTILKNHNGSILNNIPQALASDATAQDGSSIVNHILGNQQDTAAQVIGKTTNIDPTVASQVLALAAPVVMGALGKYINNNQDPSSVTSVLRNVNQNQQQTIPQHRSFITQILDQNNNGTAVDDIAQIGINMLGNIFNK